MNDVSYEDQTDNADADAKWFLNEFDGVTATVYDVRDVDSSYPPQIQVNVGDKIVYQGPHGTERFENWVNGFASGWDARRVVL